MARARNIKPSFFKNEDLAELSFEARLLFIGLWTLADREGLLEDRPKRIKMEVFPGDNVDVDAALESLHKLRFIQRYQTDGNRYIAIPNFLKHQNPHHRENPSTIPKPEASPPMQPGVSPRLDDDETPGKPEAGTGKAPDSDAMQGGVNPADSLNPDSGILNPESGIRKEARAPLQSENGEQAVKAATMRGAMAKALRDEGVTITPSHPQLIAWLEQGVTIQLAREAVDIARVRKPKPQPIAPGYLKPIIEELISNANGQGQNGATVTGQKLEWWKTGAGIEGKAAAEGISIDRNEKQPLGVYHDCLRCAIAAKIGIGPWIDTRNGTDMRIYQKFIDQSAGKKS